ncbi:cytochrome c oxidase subunit IV [Phascolomyces articulosus]|uniref:Cytochrome c oxidase subunit IV n=1 Tax=Phascolomyces articulosus TaxID=60185 RepID=A0AAD5K0Q4_9FUNG|nr:cytochrome c oxidase subunit IV [Phascolomyces articulosus]
MLRSTLFRHSRGLAPRICQRNNSTVALRDLETRWTTLSSSEQNAIAKQLEEAQKGDWKVLSTEDKKAAYYIAFGPHGPRQPITQPGHGSKVLGGVAAVLGVSSVLFWTIRVNGQETPITTTREWEEATNEYLRKQKSDPISGISSEGYKGKGYVTH